MPALGYFPEQLKELEETIDKTPCDLVLVGTPIDLRKIKKIKKPSLRVYYNMGEEAIRELTKMVSSKIWFLICNSLSIFS